MLKLDEALFDDDMTFDAPSVAIFNEGDFDAYKVDDLDDSVFTYEPIASANAVADHDGEAVPAGPATGLDSGIAASLIKLINDEWEAIQGYNDFRAMVMEMVNNNDGDYTEMLTVIDEIVNEENLHVGQLQELLKTVSPNAESINKGEEEAQEQLESSGNEWVNGKLKVEFHNPVAPQAVENEQQYNAIEDTCSICDADDDW